MRWLWVYLVFCQRVRKQGEGHPPLVPPHLPYLKALMEKGALLTRRCFPVTRFICFISEHKDTDQMSHRSTLCSEVSCTLGATVQGSHVALGRDDGQVVMIFHHRPICHVVNVPVQGPCFSAWSKATPRCSSHTCSAHITPQLNWH